MTEELSDVARMLIERVKSNPEEFFPADGIPNYPRFQNVLDSVSGRSKLDALWFMSDVDRAAIRKAVAEEAYAQFTAYVVHTIFSPPPALDTSRQYAGSMAQTKSVTAAGLIGNQFAQQQLATHSRQEQIAAAQQQSWNNSMWSGLR